MPVTPATTDFDVAIIGGGPAGAAAAAYLAKAGASCVVLERELFPRPHVGESLVPSSTRVFRDLDFLDTMEQARFPHKYGAAWTATQNARMHEMQWKDMNLESYVDVDFDEREQPGVGLDHTFHVDRGKFDLLLLQHANNLGATVYEGINVRGAEMGADGVEVHYTIGRREVSTSAQMVIDASGRRTLLGSQLGWKVKDPVFDQFALHTWFEGFDRLALADTPDKADYILIHFVPMANTWIWQIPITAEITSIGVVSQKASFSRRRTQHDDFFWQCIARRPELHDALRQAEQLRPLKAEGDYSYAMRQVCDDRVILLGDAGRFVDPIFSTGVSIALNSARFASPDVLAALESGVFTRDAFGRFETTIRRGTQNWYDFIQVYYRLNVLFSSFVRDPRYRLDVLKLLQGDVYDEDAPPVLDEMRAVVREVEQNPQHIWHGLLNDLTVNAFQPVV